MTDARTLLLLRHATAEPGRPGQSDRDRPLTPRGRAEAAGVGAFLAQQGWDVDLALCSPAVRTRQTLDQLRLPPPPDGPQVELEPRLYLAEAAELLELVGLVGVSTVLVVGHAPAVPEGVARLADADVSAPAAVAAVASRFPPATLAVLRMPDPAVMAGALVGVRLAEGSAGSWWD